MDEYRRMKEQIINEYIHDILSDGFIDVKQSKEYLKNRLGEEPAIQLAYDKEEKINEGSGEVEQIEKLQSITVYYTYDTVINNESVPAFGKLEYIVNI